MKHKILVITEFYIPSVKGGGPIQSIKNIVENLSDYYDFYIITSDRDFGDSSPFNGILSNEWLLINKHHICYLDIKHNYIKNLIEKINECNPELLYINSFFSFKFSIIPVLLYRINKIKMKKIIIAPRGELSTGALEIKHFKKNFFINISKIFKLHRYVVWHATADIEKDNIYSVFYNNNIFVISNLTENYSKFSFDKKLNKNSGELNIIFISRIHPKKNLYSAINFLKELKGNIIFDIFGPIEDKKYWNKCINLIDTLPVNIKVSYKGIIDHDLIIDTFKKYHIFLFPTLSENFGHVISEALIGGCPVVVSDQTPWRYLDKYNAGWDIPLDQNNTYIRKLQDYVDMDEKDYFKVSESSFNFVKEKLKKDIIVEKYLTLFECKD